MHDDLAYPRRDEVALDAALGAAVAAARQAAGLTRADLAARLGVGEHALAHVEDGAARLSLSRLVSLAEEVGADPLDLVVDALGDAMHTAGRQPGQTTRLVRAVHGLHPDKREHARALLVAVAGA